MRIKQRWIRTVLIIIFSIIAVTSVYPLLWLLINSFKDTTEIMTGASFGLPEFWKIENYTDALFNRNILKYFINSIFITGFTLLLTTIAAMVINTFINSWNEFIYSLVLISDDAYKTLPIALMSYSSGRYGTDYGGMFAAMIITSILPVLLFIFFSNQVEKTFSAGAILK